MADNTDTAPAMLTLEEVAALLRVDTDAAMALIDSGELQAFKVGSDWRILDHHLTDYLRCQLDAQQRRVIENAMRDPRLFAREAVRHPDLLQYLNGQTFEPGTMGAFLQQGLRAIEQEEAAENVIPLRPTED